MEQGLKEVRGDKGKNQNLPHLSFARIPSYSLQRQFSTRVDLDEVLIVGSKKLVQGGKKKQSGGRMIRKSMQSTNLCQIPWLPNEIYNPYLAFQIQMLQVGVVDLVSPTAPRANDVLHTARELDHVLRAKSFPTAPYARRLPLATSKSSSISEKVATGWY